MKHCSNSCNLVARVDTWKASSRDVQQECRDQNYVSGLQAVVLRWQIKLVC